jgi:long-chain acyl-CoA synthetase
MMTLATMLKSTGQVYGRRPAIIDAGGNLNWTQYVERIARTAGALRALDLAPQQRIATLCRNSVLHGQLLYGAYWAGVVPVVLNFRLSAGEILGLLDDAECELLFIDNAYLPLLEQEAFAHWRGKTILMPVDGGAHANMPSFPALVEKAEPLPCHQAHEDDDALMLYTGGTTGLGKGVRLSHRNVLTNAYQLARVMKPDEYDIYLHVSPMFHSTDLKATVVTMYGGAHIYHKEFRVDAILNAVEQQRVSILSIVPTMIVRVLQEGELKQRDLSALRLISYGTSPIGEGTLRAAMQAFPGVGFHQCYGLTECSPLIALLDEAAHRRSLKDKPSLLRAAGRPFPNLEMRFVDEDGRDVPAGEPGEVVVRGPQVSKGYWKRDADNAAAYRDGWFHTGDIGVLDEDGYLFVLDRKKDMVITGGENVYTREVESALQLHPALTEVAVVGVPDAQYGEALLAAVVVREGHAAPTPAELIAFCRGHLGGYKIPRRYVLLPALPRTPMGKVKKNEIVEMGSKSAA